ncbi:exopolysaccharide biosynthesis protein [Martelella endophytica]|uniref:Exopolysaccharide biosynthesis protein exod n=1 Tax=Martelella endophytica TaxID=1486262 RepID=A0A0D5LT54_MAREN|nr:exopolysaccharide biosynthesis protein [Martelella endophytica]AJY47160.1 exopolysaccharide biosynthesis protein exod [Martelella endophytica]
MADEQAEAEHGRRLSDILAELRPDESGRVSLRQLDEALADRSFGAFLVVFAIPNLVPLPPGATLVLGIPLILIAWQMMASRHNAIWLPERIARVSIDGKRCADALDKILPWLRWIEGGIRPRAWFLKTRRSERLLGAYALILAIVVFCPIPFGNWLPALALGIIGLSVTERDGYGIIVGSIVGVVAILLAGLVVLAAGALLALIF